ncbi:hypothetical protein MDA_GLEAN10012279 [Myotis davidii]|uniref:Uncharacterized protein n=1 Tax=Myotis davidii TaxID=225400 RepID=L5LGF0_MYODS|nr:hypothetical protein MDA_GLEAN10012279 [Myotis davidii]
MSRVSGKSDTEVPTAYSKVCQGLGGTIVGLGPSKRPEQPHLQIPPQASPPAPGWEGHGKQLAATALGNPVGEKAAPPGPLANAVEMAKKRVTRRLNCCTPRLPLAHEPQEQLGLTGQPKALTANEASSPAAFNYLNRKWQNRARGRISLSSHFHSGCFPFPEAADGLLPGPRGSGQASGMVSPGASSFLCRAAVVARPWDLSPAGAGFIFLVMQGCCGASPGCGQRGHFHAASQASPRHSSARQREARGGEGH